MNQIPVWIIGLWWFPLVVCIALPLVLLCCWLVVTGLMRLVSGLRGRVMTVAEREKRRDRRIHSDDLVIDVSDGVNLATGSACNVSQMGICIMGIPKKLTANAERLAVVVDNNGETYSLHVRPRWQKNHASGRKIGASIEYAPAGWSEFIQRSGAFSSG